MTTKLKEHLWHIEKKKRKKKECDRFLQCVKEKKEKEKEKEEKKDVREVLGPNSKETASEVKVVSVVPSSNH